MSEYGKNGYGDGPYGASGVPAGAINLGWNLQNFPSRDYPFPPFNGEVTGSGKRGVLDVRWDCPALLSANTPWRVLGVNIYRSDVGERGPYHRLNPLPLGGTFYRDYTDIISVTNEIVRWDSSWMFRGKSPNGRLWAFRTMFPIYKRSAHSCIPANAPTDVTVTINGVPAGIHSVFGPGGEVVLINAPTYDQVTDNFDQVVLPSGPESEVLVTYNTVRNAVSFELDRKIFYRISTVAVHEEAPGNLIETPLRYCQPLTPYKVEALDWMWREAVRRNNWILEQGGERVNVFVRKTAGEVCDCRMDRKRRSYNGQPKNNCLECFGTGFLGGYEGPYEAIMAPDDAERRVAQTQWGRHVEHSYEVWFGPTPLLTQRDFVVKQTNERYSIGPVRKPTNRGNIMQQHFTIRRLDEPDIRYAVPIDGLNGLPWPESRLTIDPEERLLVYPLAEYGPMHQLEPCEHGPQVYPDSPDPQAMPMGTEKKNIGDSREHRGRTQTWENHNYVWFLMPFALWLLKVFASMSEAAPLG